MSLLKTDEKGFTCECGTYHEFPMYVFAHWRNIILHTCEECGAKHEVICGSVTLKQAGSKKRRGKK